MKFNYKAVKADGAEVTGVAEAVDRFALSRELRAQGLTLVSVKSEAEAGKRGVLGRLEFLQHLSIKQQAMIAGSLGAMVGAGLSLSRSLVVLSHQAGPQTYLGRLLKTVEEKIAGGSSLSQALGLYPRDFSSLFVAMVAAGEESGKLTESLGMIRTQLGNQYDLHRKVRGAMIYPSIIVAAIIGVGILMMIFVVPNIVGIFKDLNVELPFATRVLIAVSNFTSNHPVFLLGGLVALIGGFLAFRRSTRGRRLIAQAVLHLPVIKTVVKNYNAAMAMRTLASLIAAGVQMIQALEIAARVVQNPIFRQVLEAAGATVVKGSPLSKSFHDAEKTYPPLVGELIEVGEETGNLSGMLAKGADFFEEEVDQATKNLSTIIEPVLMVLIGIAVAFFALSIIGPIYSLSDAI